MPSKPILANITVSAAKTAERRAQQNQSYVIVLGVISTRIRESKQKTQDGVVITARI
jgi:hypothetical protein